MANILDMIQGVAQGPTNFINAYNTGVATKQAREDSELQRRQLIHQIEGLIQQNRKRKAEATLQEEELLPEATTARSKKRQADVIKSDADIKYTMPERQAGLAQTKAQTEASRASTASSYASTEAAKIRTEINKVELQNQQLNYLLTSNPNNIEAAKLKQKNDLKAEQLRGLYMEQIAAAEVKEKEADADKAVMESRATGGTPGGKEKDYEFMKKTNQQLGLGMPDELLFKVASGAIEEIVDTTTGDRILVDVFDAFNPRKLTAQESNKVDYVSKASGSGVPTHIPGRVVVGRGSKVGERVREEARTFSRMIHQSGIPTAWDLVNKTLKDVEGKADLPGYGQTGALPFMALTEEGKALRQQVQTLFNVTLKDRSGAAVTNPELQRLKIEFGTGIFKSDADLKRGLKNFKEALQSEINNVVAGTSLPAILAYGAAGGSDLIMQSNRLSNIEKGILAASKKNPNMTLEEIIEYGKSAGIVPKDYDLSKFLR